MRVLRAGEKERVAEIRILAAGDGLHGRQERRARAGVNGTAAVVMACIVGINMVNHLKNQTK